MLEPLSHLIPRRVAAGRRLRGFTLLELVIVLAVLTVVGALAVPAIGARMQHARLLAAADTLAGDLANARFEAARRGQSLYLQPSAGPAWCWSVATAPDCGCGQTQQCQIRSVRSSDHPGVRLLDAQAVRLDPSGTVQGGSATLESPRGERLQVSISPMGRPRVCAAQGSWPQLPAC